MDPITLSLAATAAAGAVSAAGAIQKGAADQSMYQYQQSVAAVNAKIAEQNRQYEMAAGDLTAQRKGVQLAQEKGRYEAGRGSSGLDVTRGSAAEGLKSLQEMASLDEATIRANATRKAYGYEVEETQHKAQEKLYGAAAEEAPIAAGFSATASLLSAAGNVSDKWMRYKEMSMV